MLATVYHEKFLLFSWRISRHGDWRLKRHYSLQLRCQSQMASSLYFQVVPLGSRRQMHHNNRRTQPMGPSFSSMRRWKSKDELESSTLIFVYQFWSRETCEAHEIKSQISFQTNKHSLGPSICSPSILWVLFNGQISGQKRKKEWEKRLLLAKFITASSHRRKAFHEAWFFVSSEQGESVIKIYSMR